MGNNDTSWIIAILIFVIIIILARYVPRAEQTTQSVATLCLDNDLGDNQYVASSCNDIIITFEDHCEKNILNEAICQNNKCAYKTINCLYGCEAGKCKKLT